MNTAEQPWRTFPSRWSLVGALAWIALVGCQRQESFGPVADIDVAKNIRSVLATSSMATEGGQATAGAEATGWATIRGQFVYSGPPPKQPPPYDVTKEQNICTINGQPPRQEMLIVSDAGAIKNVAIYLRAAKRVHDSAKTPGQPFVFDQKHCQFLTHVFGVMTGQTVEIKNSDPTGHNTKIGGSNSFNQTIPEGQAIPFKPQKEEALPTPVMCSIHPWMIAYMLPRSNGYYAISDEQGRFEIANVPAGEELEFQVWHESGAAAGGGLVGTTPDDNSLKWNNRGRVTVTLQPDQVKEVKVTVPASAFRL